MKRQVAMVSIALVSFLAGTLFSLGSTASGIISNPFGNRLNDISKLQAQIDSLNATLTELKKRTHIEIVRFTEPKEMNVTARVGDYYNLTKFIWTPRNPQNNTILEVHYQFEYYCENPEQFTWGQGYAFRWQFLLYLRINEFVTEEIEFTKTAVTLQEWEEENPPTWQYASFVAHPDVFDSIMGLWVSPNQNNYTLRFDCTHWSGWQSHTYVRNISVILLVVDGS